MGSNDRAAAYAALKDQECYLKRDMWLPAIEVCPDLDLQHLIGISIANSAYASKLVIIKHDSGDREPCPDR